MSPAEAEALAAVAPPFKDLESGARKGDVVEAKEEKKGKDPKEKEQQEQQAKEQTVELPADIQSQFPDSDLSKVVVILNSGEATKRRLKGFAENGTIHIAEGADQKPVMRHEASHIAQQLKGEKGEAPAGGGAGGGGAGAAGGGAGAAGGGGAEAGGAAGPAGAGAGGAGAAAGGAGAAAGGAGAAAGGAGAAAGGAGGGGVEAQAAQAEGGAQQGGQELQAASPSSSLGYGNGAAEGKREDGGLGDKGVPKVSFNIGKGGITLDSISGSFSKDILDAKWDEKKIFEGNHTFRFPALPIGGIYVAAGLSFKPEAKVSAKANYEWKPADKEFSVSGTLEGGISGALTGYVEGGLALDAVVQKGGVGLRAALTATAAAKFTQGIKFTYSAAKGFSWGLTTTDIDIGADIKAALSLRAWTEGWFSNKVASWTFAEFNIACLTGGKLQIEIGNSSGKVVPTMKKLGPGKMGWGKAPDATESNAQH